ncbi:MAG: flavin reductase, partial [Suilimivivens sp.]
MNPATMFKLTYGLFVLTSRFENKDSGCIINTAAQVIAEPNRISITVNKANFTHDLVMNSGTFNVSILSEAASF